MSNLSPVSIVDKNGKATTVHKKSASAGTSKTRAKSVAKPKSAALSRQETFQELSKKRDSYREESDHYYLFSTIAGSDTEDMMSADGAIDYLATMEREVESGELDRSALDDVQAWVRAHKLS